MPTVQQQREKLVNLLKELFQLDQPDLDFGFYKIMHAKAKQVTAFLENDLLKTIEQAFGKTSGEAVVSKLEQIKTKVIQQLGAAAINADGSLAEAFRATPIGEQYQSALETLKLSQDTSRSEGEVYDHLYRFFERYYDAGDFMSRRYLSRETSSKAAAYAVPYDGSEVYTALGQQGPVLHQDYRVPHEFHFRPNEVPEVRADRADLFGKAEPAPMPVHFRLVAATEGEHGNVKPSEASRCYFILHKEDPVSIENEQLIVRFEHRPDPDKTGKEGKWQTIRNEEAVASILEALSAMGNVRANEYMTILRTLAPTETQGDRPLLAKYVAQYTARNTMDYFIHKDLNGFLRRELDFYIKNEVMRLDDIESGDAPKVEQYLAQVRVLRQIAGKMIDFLAHLEDFQRKLWLKKKFVTETHYCITLDRIPEALYGEIAASEAQREEWVHLFDIDSIKPSLNTPGYSAPLTVEFLKAHRCLPVDTAMFDASFRDRLLAALTGLDQNVHGIVVCSENSQALRLLQPLLAGRIDCVYTDPPYNTTEIGFIYKNAYQHSSWCAMVANSLRHALPLLANHAVLACTIDDFEQPYLEMVCDEVLGFWGRLGNLIIETKPSGRTNDRFLATSHEYCLLYAINPDAVEITLFELSEEQKGEYASTDGKGAHKWRDFLRTGGFSTPEERPNSYYPIYFDPASDTISLEEKPGMVAIWPIDTEERRRVWRKTPPSFAKHLTAGEIKIAQKRNGDYKVLIIDRIKEGIRPKSVWTGSRYDSATHGTKLLKSLFGESGTFTFPKSLWATRDVLYAVTGEDEEAIVCDFFAGSGTTAHAVIDLNRSDGGRRKYVLVEMGEHFDTALRPRILKAAYATEWDGGKPKTHTTGISHVVKYVRLESYEDCLNNLELKDDSDRDKSLAQNPGLREDYMLHYMLDVETQGSASLLNIDQFADPMTYKLKVKKSSSDDYDWRNVDLLETFNYLIGLRVEHIAAPQAFSAEFEREADPDLPRGQLGRLVINGRLKQDLNGKWWFRKVEGWVPKNPQTPNDGQREKVLIVWRKLTGDIEQDNLVLDEWFSQVPDQPTGEL